MKGNHKISALQYILFTALGVALAWWQISSMSANDKVQFKDAFKDVHLHVLAPVIIFNLLSHLFRALRWRMLMQPMGYNPTWQNLFSGVLIGNMVNTLLPRVGEVARCTIVYKEEKIPFQTVLGTVISERAIDLISFAIFTGIAWMLNTTLIGGFLSQKLQGVSFLNIALVGLATIVFLWISFKALITFARKHPTQKFVVKVVEFLKGIIGGISSVKNLRNPILFIVYTAVIWLFYMLQIYAGFKAMDATAHLTIPHAFAVLTMATLAIMLTPGGLGSFPIFVSQALVLFGIAAVMGNAFGWLMWGIGTIITLISGILAWFIVPYLPNGKHSTTVAS